MTQWRLITWKDYEVRTHIVCVELEALLIAEMAERKPKVPVTEAKDHTSDGINMPGMCYVDRPDETFELDGISLEVPCEDVGDILGRLQRMTVRHFGEVPYYKLHSFLRCLVLTPGQRDDFIGLLSARLERADRRSVAFYESRKAPSQVLREVAAHVTGDPIEAVPDLGGHKADRFKERGP